MQKNHILGIIISSLKQIISEQDAEFSAGDFNESSRLFGPGSLLDSLSLVSLIVDIEQRLQEKLDISIAIADERAMSLEKSPFRTIGTLAEYVQFLVEEKTKDV